MLLQVIWLIKCCPCFGNKSSKCPTYTLIYVQKLSWYNFNSWIKPCSQFLPFLIQKTSWLSHHHLILFHGNNTRNLSVNRRQLYDAVISMAVVSWFDLGKSTPCQTERPLLPTLLWLFPVYHFCFRARGGISIGTIDRYVHRNVLSFTKISFHSNLVLN